MTDTRGHANSTEAVLTIQNGDELLHKKKSSTDKKESGKERKSKKTTTISTTARATSTLTSEMTTTTTSVTTTSQGAPVKLDAQTPSTASEETSTIPPAGTRCCVIVHYSISILEWTRKLFASGDHSYL